MPFWAADQDALNALLMSEIRADAVEALPAAHEVHPHDLANTRIIDTQTLECTLNGERPAILHYSMSPKAWDRKGWLRVRRDAYVTLFSRVACGSDASLRLKPEELPLWLRPGLCGKVLWPPSTWRTGSSAEPGADCRRAPPQQYFELRTR